MKKTIIISIAVVVGVAAAAFFGGMKYSEAQVTRNRGGMFADVQQRSPEERQQMAQRFQAGGAGGGGRVLGREGANAVVGEILQRDDKSITVSLPDGGSRIILLPESVTVARTSEASANDLAIGQQVSIFGSANDDGSVVAQSIQIRPAPPTKNQ